MLPNASTAELEQEVARRVYDLGRNGGYILAPCHNIGHDIPPENVVTLFEKAREFGQNPTRLKEMVESGIPYFTPAAFCNQRIKILDGPAREGPQPMSLVILLKRLEASTGTATLRCPNPPPFSTNARIERPFATLDAS